MYRMFCARGPQITGIACGSVPVIGKAEVMPLMTVTG